MHKSTCSVLVYFDWDYIVDMTEPRLGEACENILLLNMSQSQNINRSCGGGNLRGNKSVEFYLL